MANGDFTHVEIPADDLARAQRFYENAFGWSFRGYEGFEGYTGFTTPGAGDAGVGGAIGSRGQTAPDRLRIYVEVDSIDSALSGVRSAGGSVVTEKTAIPGMGAYAVIADTEGNELGLYESQR